MPYTAPINRSNPACVLLLIDQSGSMAEPFLGAPGLTKAAVVADAVNRTLQNLVLRSAKLGGVRDYFHVGVIQYGKAVRAGLGGAAPYDVLLPISRLGEHPIRVEDRTRVVPDGAGGRAELPYKFPVWFDPQTGGPTPMTEAFAAAGLAVKGFIDKHPKSFPPVVLNLTDGKPTDGNPQANARLIRNLATADGNAVVFNLLLSSAPLPAVAFPADEAGLADDFARMLFRMSSLLPEPLLRAARAEGYAAGPGARGLVLNADPTAVVRFLDVGTRIAPAPGPAG